MGVVAVPLVVVVVAAAVAVVVVAAVAGIYNYLVAVAVYSVSIVDRLTFHKQKPYMLAALFADISWSYDIRK